MRRWFLALGGVLIALLLTASMVAAQQSITITLSQQNNSGESGTATLTAVGTNQTRVVIQLKGAPANVAQPAHIHEGTCANLNPVPKYPLNNVVNGMSDTTVNVALSDLLAKPFAINVHKSAQEIQTYVACGNIVGSVAPATGQPRATLGLLPVALAAVAGLGLIAAGLGLRHVRG